MVDRQALKPFALTIKPPIAGPRLVPNPSPTLISLTSYLTFELCREKQEGLVQLLRQLQGGLDFQLDFAQFKGQICRQETELERAWRQG